MNIINILILFNADYNYLRRIDDINLKEFNEALFKIEFIYISHY